MKGASSTSFLILAVVKSVLAAQGLSAFWTAALPSLRHDGLIVVPQARRWLWAYVGLQLVDLLQAFRKRFDWTSFLHHVTTGVGFGLDAWFGSNRTVGLAAMSLVSECVAPFYQLYFWLHAQNADMASLRVRACLHGIVWCTLLVRTPLAFFLTVVACRDTAWAYAYPHLRKELQPALMIPSVFGMQFIVFLDLVWLKSWALPKLWKCKQTC